MGRLRWLGVLDAPLGHPHADGVGAEMSAQYRAEPGLYKALRLHQIGQLVANGQGIRAARA